jgi:HTH-type transcriptional regulator/antitoxin HigA
MSADVEAIETEAQYDAALAEARRLWGAKAGTSDGDRLEALYTAIETYEDVHYPMPVGAPEDPIDAILYYLELRGLTEADLEPMIGSPRHVAEVIDRKRGLTPEMIRRLEAGLDMPAGALRHPARPPAARGAQPSR